MAVKDPANLAGYSRAGNNGDYLWASSEVSLLSIYRFIQPNKGGTTNMTDQWLPDDQLAAKPLRGFGAMMALAIIFPIHFFFLRKVTLGVIYWAIVVLLGWLIIPLIVTGIWSLVNLFLVKDWVYNYNNAILEARKRKRL